MATVTSTKDPIGLGRVQVRLRGFSEEIEVWLRLLQPIATKEGGFFFLPEEGDEVAVLPGAGQNIDDMVIIGSLYNGKRKPAIADDGENRVKEIRTRHGNRLSFTDKDGASEVLLQAGGGQVRLTLTQQSATLELFGQQNVVIQSDQKIQIHAPQIALSGGKVDLG